MKGKRVFSATELRDIAVSLLVLSVVFSYPELISNPPAVLVSLFVLGLAFIGHELSHKFVARRRGFFAEYRMWVHGLLLAVVFAVATGGTLIFAAPGAVVFSSYFVFKRPHRDDVGRIALSGPAFNIILLFLFSIAYAVTNVGVLVFASAVNGWLAIFNLIPIDPLDGGKIFKWDKRIWAITMAAAVFGFLVASGILI